MACCVFVVTICCPNLHKLVAVASPHDPSAAMDPAPWVAPLTPVCPWLLCPKLGPHSCLCNGYPPPLSTTQLYGPLQLIFKLCMW